MEMERGGCFRLKCRRVFWRGATGRPVKKWVGLLCDCLVFCLRSFLLPKANVVLGYSLACACLFVPSLPTVVHT